MYQKMMLTETGNGSASREVPPCRTLYRKALSRITSSSARSCQAPDRPAPMKKPTTSTP